MKNTEMKTIRKHWILENNEKYEKSKNRNENKGTNRYVQEEESGGKENMLPWAIFQGKHGKI